MVLDFLWPFKRKFSEIPAAREASIAGLIGGPIVGIIAFMATNRPRLILTASGYAGLAIFWVTFIKGRSDYELNQKIQKKVEGNLVVDDDDK